MVGTSGVVGSVGFAFGVDEGEVAFGETVLGAFFLLGVVAGVEAESVVAKGVFGDGDVVGIGEAAGDDGEEGCEGDL